MCTDRNKYSASGNVLVQLILEVDEGSIRAWRELDVAEDSTSNERPDTLCLFWIARSSDPRPLIVFSDYFPRDERAW